jgi:uncharacterized lipoprotein
VATATFCLTLQHFRTKNKHYFLNTWETATVREKNLLFVLMFIAAGAVLLQACASTQEREMRSMARVYDRPYDRVWSSVEELLRFDLKCAFKKNDKQDGLLETEWVHRMDTEGSKRWMVRADIRKVKNGVEVVLIKKLEMQDNVSRSLERYKKESKDPTSGGGWKKTDVAPDTVEDLYRKLGQKLEN